MERETSKQDEQCYLKEPTEKPSEHNLPHISNNFSY